MEWYTGPFRKFADISGRASRKEFWTFLAITTAVYYALFALDRAVYGPARQNISVLYLLLTAVPLFSLTMRRLRDAGRSAFFIFALLGGLPGAAVLLFLLAGPGAAPEPASEDKSAGRPDAPRTLAALFCYAVTLYWIYGLGRELDRTGSPAWTITALLALPFLYMVVRLYTKRCVPWPAGSDAVLALYAAAILLIAISLPYFSGLIRRSAEGGTLARLSEMRATLERERKKGTAAGVEELFRNAPGPKLPMTGHAPSYGVRAAEAGDAADSGRWFYDGSGLRVDCTHADSKGVPWSSY